MTTDEEAHYLLYSLYLAARAFLNDADRNEFHRLQLERAVGSYGEFEQRLGKRHVEAIEASVEDSKRPPNKAAY